MNLLVLQLLNTLQCSQASHQLHLSVDRLETRNSQSFIQLEKLCRRNPDRLESEVDCSHYTRQPHILRSVQLRYEVQLSDNKLAQYCFAVTDTIKW